MWPKLLDLTREECMKLLRRHELLAYSYLVTAFRAQGTLDVEKQRILQDIASHLKITQERHRAEVRRAVNDEKLSTIAFCLTGEDSTDAWAVEGRRLIPILRRTSPQTLYSVVADEEANKISVENDKLPFPAQTERKRPLQTALPESNKNVQYRMHSDPCHKMSDEVANKKRKTNVAVESSSLAQHLMMGPPKVSKLQQIYRQKSKPSPRQSQQATPPLKQRQNYLLHQSPSNTSKYRRTDEIGKSHVYMPDKLMLANQKQQILSQQQYQIPSTQQLQMKQTPKTQVQQQSTKVHTHQMHTQKNLQIDTHKIHSQHVHKVQVGNQLQVGTGQQLDIGQQHVGLEQQVGTGQQKIITGQQLGIAQQIQIGQQKLGVGQQQPRVRQQQSTGTLQQTEMGHQQSGVGQQVEVDQQSGLRKEQLVMVQKQIEIGQQQHTEVGQLQPGVGRQQIGVGQQQSEVGQQQIELGQQQQLELGQPHLGVGQQLQPGLEHQQQPVLGNQQPGLRHQQQGVGQQQPSEEELSAMGQIKSGEEQQQSEIEQQPRVKQEQPDYIQQLDVEQQLVAAQRQTGVEQELTGKGQQRIVSEEQQSDAGQEKIKLESEQSELQEIAQLIPQELVNDQQKLLSGQQQLLQTNHQQQPFGLQQVQVGKQQVLYTQNINAVQVQSMKSIEEQQQQQQQDRDNDITVTQQPERMLQVELPVSTNIDQTSKTKTLVLKPVNQSNAFTTGPHSACAESQPKTLKISSARKLNVSNSQSQPQKVLIVSNAQGTNSTSILQRTLTIPFIKTISMKNFERVKVINNVKNTQAVMTGTTNTGNLSSPHNIPKPKLLTVQTKGTTVNKHLNIPFIQSVQLQALQNKGAIKMVPLTATTKNSSASNTSVYIMNPNVTHQNLPVIKVENKQTNQEQIQSHQLESNIAELQQKFDKNYTVLTQDDIESQITRLTQIPNTNIQNTNQQDDEQDQRQRKKFLILQDETVIPKKKENEEMKQYLGHLDPETGTYTLKPNDEYGTLSNSDNEEGNTEDESYYINVDFLQNNDEIQ